MTPCLLVTAGPSREYFDDVRFLSNASSGRMGIAVAAAAAELGWQVHLAVSCGSGLRGGDPLGTIVRVASCIVSRSRNSTLCWSYAARLRTSILRMGAHGPRATTQYSALPIHPAI